MLQRAAGVRWATFLFILLWGGNFTGTVSTRSSTVAAPPIRVIVTAKDTNDRLAEKSPIAFADVGAAVGETIMIDDSHTFQSITGFGGSFTESAAYTLSKMSPDKRAEVLKAYFDPQDGIGYTLVPYAHQQCGFFARQLRLRRSRRRLRAAALRHLPRQKMADPDDQGRDGRHRRQNSNCSRRPGVRQRG